MNSVTNIVKRAGRGDQWIDNGHILGLISIGDVVREVISKFIIAQLENYTTGSR